MSAAIGGLIRRPRIERRKSTLVALVSVLVPLMSSPSALGAHSGRDWQPPPGATPDSGTYLYLESDPGDWVGAGGTYLYTLADAVFGATQSNGLVHLDLTGDERWDGDFKAPDSVSRAEVGYYPGLHRYPFHNPTKGGLSFSGEGRGCNTLTGWFAIDAITYDGGQMDSVTLRFEQHCDGATPALRGKLVWNRTASTRVP